ncbi:hypothetical protein [Fontivita pretiosa]|uniref:hypothetical protein n=1 Tax=Fontivita pretiosa TaxID=2989684 RepID=UPI003D17478B
MFEEPDESQTPAERAADPAQRAREKADEFRMHAELAAVFEGVRKFDAQIKPSLDMELARDVQRAMARLEKSKSPGIPVLPEESTAEAARILDLPTTSRLSTNDYYIHRRPGETMIIRWLQGEQVQTFYERLQAHFDAALNQCREDERQAHGWKQDPQWLAYLAALDAMKLNMAERYLRPLIRRHGLFVLSTQTVDEMDILHLCELIMGVSAEEVVGRASAPPESPTERDRAWFFRLFSLRGMKQQTEQMCFFTYLQKAQDSFDLE